MKNIIVIQHTQAVHHTNGMIGSLTEWELADLGKAQAECIGKRWKRNRPDSTKMSKKPNKGVWPESSLAVFDEE